MKKLDLSSFSIETLKSLREQIKIELCNRKNNDSIARRISFIHSLRAADWPDISKAITEIRLFNSQYLLELPIRKGEEPHQWTRYLPCLIAQDWSKTYPRESDSGDYYVYAHVDPRHKLFITAEEGGGNYGGRPFYIGKGIGNRAYDLKRNEGHGKTIKEILKDGYPSSCIVKLLFEGLSEKKALEIESKLVYFFGVQYSKNRKGWLVNLAEPPTPDFSGRMKHIPNKNSLDNIKESP